MKYRVLMTDVGNVIAPFDLKRFTDCLSRLTGLPFEEVDARLYAEMSGKFSSSADACKGLHRDILIGAVSPDDYRKAIQERFGCTFYAPEFWRAFREVFDVNRRLVDLWQQLRREERVERIVAVTDADPVRLAYALELTGLKPDAVAASYEVGQLKPHDDIYRRALELAQAAPQECVFVDDVAVNVQAARRFGIQSFQYFYPESPPAVATDILIHEFKRVGLLD